MRKNIKPEIKAAIKPVLKTVFWIVILIMVFWIPESSLLVGIGILLSWIWKKLDKKRFVLFETKRK